MKNKPRLDEILVDRGFFATVHDAQVAVLAGEVVVGEHRETSAGKRLAPDVPIRLKKQGQFVSRGGEKLAGALKTFPVDPRGLNCVDMGTSSGGFTDCLLQAGAAHVSAVDVGYGQFVWTLRNDDRVSLYERTNVRGIDVAGVGGPFDLAVGDLSFVSLTTLMQDIAALLKPQGQALLLIKPQFEVDKSEVGEGGIVRDASLHVRVIDGIISCASQNGLLSKGLTNSPIKGPKGNIEYLLWAQKTCDATIGQSVDRIDSAAIVSAAFEKLGGSQ